MQFQANLNEVYFELINLSYGFYLRLETLPERTQVPALNKRLVQHAFQFTYDSIYKKFTRELRDSDNKDYMLDKNFLELKRLKEQGRLENVEDPAILKFQQMSYISYLNKRQRINERLNRGLSIGDDEEEEENQSEDDSQVSEDKQEKGKSTKRGGEMHLSHTGSKSEKPPVFNPNAPSAPSAPNMLFNQTMGGADYNKMLVAAEGFGKEFIRGEIERLIQVLRDKQAAGAGIHTFLRNEGPRKGWEETKEQHTSLFSDRAGEIQKIEDEEEEEVRRGKSSEKDSDQLKASIKSKKAFSLAINDKTMPPAIKRLSRVA